MSVRAVYGAYSLYTRQFIGYISRKAVFAYFDYEEPLLCFIVDYAAVMGLMISPAYYLQRFLRHKRRFGQGWQEE